MFTRTYLCEGHDVVSAKDVYDALTFKGHMRNAKISIIDINKEECSFGNIKIQDIQSYHSVKFENGEMIFWKYFEIGAGKKVLYRNLNINCSIQVILPIQHDTKSRQKSISISKNNTFYLKFLNFIFCPEDNCTSEFETADKLSLHI